MQWNLLILFLNHAVKFVLNVTILNHPLKRLSCQDYSTKVSTWVQIISNPELQNKNKNPITLNWYFDTKRKLPWREWTWLSKKEAVWHKCSTYNTNQAKQGHKICHPNGRIWKGVNFVSAAVPPKTSNNHCL